MSPLASFAASETQETSSERIGEAIDRLGGTQAAARALAAVSGRDVDQERRGLCRWRSGVNPHWRTAAFLPEALDGDPAERRESNANQAKLDSMHKTRGDSFHGSLRVLGSQLAGGTVVHLVDSGRRRAGTAGDGRSRSGGHLLDGWPDLLPGENSSSGVTAVTVSVDLRNLVTEASRDRAKCARPHGAFPKGHLPRVYTRGGVRPGVYAEEGPAL